eukprot:c5253_g1_i2 orf=1-1899(-)
MIFAVHVIVLLLVCEHVPMVIPRAYGHEGEGEAMKEKELGTHGCQCMKNQNVEGQSDVVSILRTGGHLDNSFCSCGHDSRLQQRAFGLFKSWLLPHKLRLAFPRFRCPLKGSNAYLPPLASPVHRSLTTLYFRKILTSPQESTSYRYSAKMPSPAINLRSQQGSPHSVASLPPTAQNYAVAPVPSSSAPKTETTMPTAAPHAPRFSPHTLQKRHHHGHNQSTSTEHSLSPVPGPKVASSPAHGHLSTAFSPSPDCSAVVCLSPLTKGSFVSRCGCVRPIEVEIELSVPLYALFPLISVLAGELAKSIVLSPRQVEIVGANTSGRNQEFSIVDTKFVPLGKDFDILTATIISQKFWSHEVALNRTLFGNYTVVYVHYPGLPPSPPSETQGGQASIMGGISKPFGVNVSTPSKKKFGISTIAAIVLSSAVALVICCGAVWLMLLKRRHCAATHPSKQLVHARAKKAGGCSLLYSDRGSSTSLSFTSSSVTYASTARLFTIAELDRATDQFAPENIIGEGGFGRVFCGVLEDGTKVAVKLLTRDDHQGGKEFIAEVEMLSRLHHRNLVKLIGICTEERTRCLVYELVPNGSVESHLHGKDACALDWETRMKIALGAARGLAYLHEDSNPRVIHRDF